MAMDPDAPRRLTRKEIDDITQAVPEVAAACRTVREHIQKEIRNEIAKMLRDVRITPKGFDLLKEMIVEQFQRSVAEPGSAIGITAAESFGQPLTQGALNSFHQSGSAQAISRGVEAFREMFNMSQEKKIETTSIHFKDVARAKKYSGYTFEEVLDLRRKIVGVSVKDLILKQTFEMPVDYEKDEESVDFSKLDWWYKNYVTISDRPFVRSSVYVRLYLNRFMMYNHYITIHDVIRILEEKIGKIKCYGYGGKQPVVDIYPNENLIPTEFDKSIDPERAPIIYLQSFVIPELHKLTVSGISGIKQIFPTSVPTVSIFKYEEPYFKNEEERALLLQDVKGEGGSDKEAERFVRKRENTWRLHLDRIQMRFKGVPYTKFYELLEALDMQRDLIGDFHAVDDNNDPVASYDRWNFDGPSDDVVLFNLSITREDAIRQFVAKLSEIESVTGAEPNPEKALSFSEYTHSPLNYFRNMVRLETDLVRKREEQLVKEADSSNFFRASSDLHRAGYYVYAEANGSNLSKVLAHPLVESNRTMCNNAHAIVAALGIDAARNFIMREYYEIIKYNGSSINPKHTILTADFHTSIGVLLSITSRGAARSNPGALALASFERPVDAFFKAAVFGERKPINSLSPAIFAGSLAPVGTGAINVVLDTAALEKAYARVAAQREEMSNYTELQKELNKGVRREDLEQVNEQLVHNDNEEEVGVEMAVDAAVAERALSPSAQRAAKVEVVTKPVFNSGLVLCPKPEYPKVEVSKLSLPKLIADIINRKELKATPQKIGMLTPLRAVGTPQKTPARPGIIKGTAKPPSPKPAAKPVATPPSPKPVAAKPKRRGINLAVDAATAEDFLKE
jgi:hypothetical protein